MGDVEKKDANIAILPNIDNNIVSVIEEEEVPKPIKKKKITKAEKKEQKLKAAQELRKFEIREELKRELELSKKTAKRCREDWESLCKAITIKDMRTDLLDWKEKTQRLMKRKDSIISGLIEDINTTEEMHQRYFSHELKLVDFLKETLRAFGESARILYVTRAEEMIHNLYDEVEKTHCISQEAQIKSENIMHSAGVVIESQMQTEFNIFLYKSNDRVNTEIERRYRIRDHITSKMKILQKKLISFTDALKSASLDVHKYDRIDHFMDRQKNFVVESRKLDDLETRNANICNSLQRDLLHINAESQRKIKDLRLEHAYFVQMRKHIEREMIRDRKNTHEKLKIVTNKAYKLINNYRSESKYGELLLSLANSCRKLQTESEKVLPWVDTQKIGDSNDNVDRFHVKALDLKSHIDMSDEQLRANIILMSNFWKRQALTETQVELLKLKIRKLKKKNNEYIETIKSLQNSEDISSLSKAFQIVQLMPDTSLSKVCLRRPH